MLNTPRNWASVAWDKMSLWGKNAFMTHIEEENEIRKVFWVERDSLIMLLACTFHKATSSSWFGSALPSSTESFSQALSSRMGIQLPKSLGFQTGHCLSSPSSLPRSWLASEIVLYPWWNFWLVVGNVCYKPYFETIKGPPASIYRCFPRDISLMKLQ